MIFAPYSFQFSICSESQALNASLIYFQYNSVNVNLKDPKKFITFMMFENTNVETVTNSHNPKNIGRSDFYTSTCISD